MPTPTDVVLPATPAEPLIMTLGAMDEPKPTDNALSPPEKPTAAPMVVSPTDSPAGIGKLFSAAAMAPC